MCIEPSTAGKLLSKQIIEKIEEEAKQLNFIKNKTKKAKLPID
jgi:predicted transcriptional regulator